MLAPIELSQDVTVGSQTQVSGRETIFLISEPSLQSLKYLWKEDWNNSFIIYFLSLKVESNQEIKV